MDVGVGGLEDPVGNGDGRDLGPVDHRSRLPIRRVVEAKGVRMHGPNRPAMRDDQHQLTGVLASDAPHRFENPAAHLGQRLSALPAPPGARSHLGVRLAEACLDLVLREPCPRSDVDLAQLLQGRDPQTLPLRDGDGGLVGAPEVAGVYGCDRNAFELLGERPGLLAAAVVEREVGEPLPAFLAVPVRLRVAHKEDRRFRESSCVSSMRHVSIESHRSPQDDGETGVAPQEALPGLATAFDEEAMKGHIGAALFGPDRPSWTVERCTPTRPLYVPGEYCIVRYRFRAANSTSGAVLEPIVMGRVFPNESACDAYMSDKLAPLAERMRGRPEVGALAAPAATIDALNMVVHVWPVDGELPTLVDATDPRRMIEVFREELPEALKQPFVVGDCRIELVSYRRRQRCVLRYAVEGKPPDGDEVRRLIVYGKVTAFGNEALNHRLIDALRDRIREPAAGLRFAIPRSFGSRPDLRLSLLEALPGKAEIGPALHARLRGRPAAGARPLEEMVATCGHVAALLHASGVELGHARTLDDELDGLQRQVATAGQLVPRFCDRAQSWLERIAALGEQARPLKLRLGHGDFKHEQLLFDGSASGLVDFDALCQAEPALDLGKFLAHLRSEVRKLESRASVSSPLADELSEQFLDAYLGAAGDNVYDEPRLRVRTALYEAVALVRLALRSLLDLDDTRLERTTALVEERLSALAGDYPVTRRT